MLSKLLKYEIKATGRIFLPLFLALLMFAGITRLISAFGPEKWNTPATISMVIYMFIMAGMFVMTFLMMIQRFNRNLLSDEGYLMLTLPVKTWKHILSKLLVSMLWIMASGIAALFSIMIIAFQKGDLSTVFQGFFTAYREAFAQLGAYLYLVSFELIILALLCLAAGILIIYASIAIGHLVNRHKMLASFGAFIALNTLSQIYFILISKSPIADFINTHLSSYNFSGSHYPEQLIIACGIIIIGLLSAAYFAAANFILSKKLNLE